jgi:hypothetical protein
MVDGMVWVSRQTQTEAEMSRHPYTYACDFIRALAGHDEHGINLSRSDASKIRQGIAQAIRMDDSELACKLSDYFQANNEEIAAKSIRDFALQRGRSLRHYDEAKNDGLERAALHLQRKADKMRAQPNGSDPTADMMARIFEGEAAEMLALRENFDA